MADAYSPNIRVSDTERETALSALSEHLTSGRLDIEEYGDRTAKVSAAKTRGDLLALFTDLPAPHPTFGPGAPPPPPAPEPPVVVPPLQYRVPVAARVANGLVPLGFLAAALLFFAFHFPWFIFLAPIALVMLSGAIFGDDWKRHKKLADEEYKRRRREIRRRDWNG